MKNQRIAVAAAGLFLAALIPLQADAAGCAKGAVAGGVVGHVAGKHGVAGAAAGCAIGHHEASKKQKEADRANDSDANRADNGQRAPDSK